MYAYKLTLSSPSQFPQTSLLIDWCVLREREREEGREREQGEREKEKEQKKEGDKHVVIVTIQGK